MAPASSCCASDTGLRLPLALYLRLYRRWIVESPRFTHLSAVPAVKVPGCPFPSHFRYRRRSVSGLPRTLILRHRLMDVRVTSDRSPSGSPWSIPRVSPASPPWLTTIDQFPGCPKSPSLAVRRFASIRVSPNLCPSADPYLLSRVAPLPHLRLSR